VPAHLRWYGSRSLRSCILLQLAEEPEHTLYLDI